MLNRLLRWLARAEIERVQVESDRLLAQAYANGFTAGRVIGHGEMLAHLRGEPEERVTSAMMAASAKAMVH